MSISFIITITFLSAPYRPTIYGEESVLLAWFTFTDSLRGLLRFVNWRSFDISKLTSLELNTSQITETLLEGICDLCMLRSPCTCVQSDWSMRSSCGLIGTCAVR